MELNLFTSQSELFSKILQGAQSEDVRSNKEWKVLVYDHRARDILGVLFKVANLRQFGVTLHMLINSDRQPIPDAPAIYICQPTDANIERICADCKSSQYKSFSINFLSPLSLNMLDRLAEQLAPLPSHTHIRVADHTADFLTTEKDFFSLELGSTYRQLNSCVAEQASLERLLNACAESICSVILTLQVIPVLVSLPDGPACAVAHTLRKLLSEALKDRRLVPHSGAPRPLLLLCDRDIDLVSMVVHTWTYQALVSDVLGLHCNRTSTQEDGGAGGKPKTRKFELDAAGGADIFWTRLYRRAFSDVSADIDSEVKAFQATKDSLRGAASGASLAATAANSAKGGTDLTAVRSQVEKKRFLDLHTLLAVAVNDVVRGRRVDMFHYLERSIIYNEPFEKSVFRQMLLGQHKDTRGATPEDRARLAIVFYLSKGPDEAIEEFEKNVKMEHPNVAGRLLGALAQVKMMRAFLTQRKGAGHDGAGGRSDALSRMWSAASTLTQPLKSLLGKEEVQLAPLARLVDAIISDRFSANSSRSPASPAPGRAGDVSAAEKLMEGLQCFDPKHGTTVPLKTVARQFTTAIVLMVGGGNYAEYHNLKDWEESQAPVVADSGSAPRRVIYGVTDIANPTAFIDEVRFLLDYIYLVSLLCLCSVCCALYSWLLFTQIRDWTALCDCSARSQSCCHQPRNSLCSPITIFCNASATYVCALRM